MFSIRAILFIFALAIAVLAQSGEIDQTPPCILNCVVTGAAEANCPITMDNASYNCVCSSAKFENSTSTCLHKFCTNDEIQMASTLQTQRCAAAALNTTNSATNGASSANSTAESLAGKTADATSLFRDGRNPLIFFGAFVIGLLFLHA